MKKDIQNANAIASKLGLVLIKIINYRLEKAKKEKQKREKIIEKRKIEAMAAKYCRARVRISSSSADKENYESDTKDNTDLGKAANNKNLL